MKIMQKCKNGGGFTLAEMLIVMAVVVVLAAATMPAINGQVETARETNDIDAIRAAYIDAYTSEYVKFANDGAVTADGVGKTITLTQKTAGWSGSTPKIDGKEISFPNTVTIGETNKVTFKFIADGAGIKLAESGAIVVGANA